MPGALRVASSSVLASPDTYFGSPSAAPPSSGCFKTPCSEIVQPLASPSLANSSLNFDFKPSQEERTAGLGEELAQGFVMAEYFVVDLQA